MDFKQIEEKAQDRLRANNGIYGLTCYFAALIPEENRPLVIKTLTQKNADLKEVVKELQNKIADREVAVGFLDYSYRNRSSNGVANSLTMCIPEENKPAIIKGLRQGIDDLKQNVRRLQDRITDSEQFISSLELSIFDFLT